MRSVCRGHRLATLRPLLADNKAQMSYLTGELFFLLFSLNVEAGSESAAVTVFGRAFQPPGVE